MKESNKLDRTRIIDLIQGGLMGYLILLVIIILWFFLGRLLRQKYNLPKRMWGYKHERKGFAVLFYLIILACIFYAYNNPNANLFLLFPFIGTLVNVSFSLEQFLYKRTNRLYIVYLFDAVVWFVLGIAVNLIFG